MYDRRPVLPRYWVWRCRQSPANRRAVSSCRFRIRQERFAALDARLEAAAVTAALIRAYNVVVVMAEQNLNLMSVISKLISQDPDAPVQQPGRQATLEKEERFAVPWTPHWNSSFRLIGEIENSSSIDDISARADVVQRAMGFRGQDRSKQRCQQSCCTLS